MLAAKDELFTRPSGGYTIARSVRLRQSATAYFSRTMGTPTSQNKWTYSLWCKRGALGANDKGLLQGGGLSTSNYYEFTSGDALQVAITSGGGFITSAVYRDVSAWYHLVLAVDAAASGSNKMRLYVNGVEVTSFATDTRSSFTGSTINQSGQTNYVGLAFSTTYTFDGQFADVNFIDGQALTPSSFGTTNAITGVWQPAKYTGTYGTNGFYLNFSDNSNNTATTIGKDYSGNGNNWTPNNISVTAGSTYDSMTDVPTLTSATAANYAVMNPLNIGSAYLSAGNLKHTGSGWSGTSGTISVSSGKWYWEVTCTTYGGSNFTQHGIVAATRILGAVEPDTLSDAYVYSNNGQKYNNNSGSAYGATYTTGDVIGVALDMDAGTLIFYKNNASQGTAYSSLTGTFTACLGCYTGGVLDINFGQRPFSYTPPTGFVALNTYNLPASTITNGAAYMAATTYTGNGASLTVANTVGSTSFQPDWVWAKSRSAATDHALYDSVRGVQKQLESNSTGAETTETTGLTAFGSTGFTVGALAQMNTSAATYVAWQWKAGTASSSNTNGSITSTVSVGATQGFSVVTFTSDGTTASGTVGHGLGVTPSMVIYKGRNTVENWFTYHVTLGGSNALFLNLTNASTGTALFNATTPTSSVIQFKQSNWGAGTVVAYCFAAVAGYSAFGSYTGNGSTDGPFVYTGFRPRFVMIKNITNAQPWIIVDTSRNTYNQAGDYLQPNSSAAENGGSAVSTATADDILSNGFKLRNNASSSGYTNANGDTYIYAAFAESPFKTSLAR